MATQQPSTRSDFYVYALFRDGTGEPFYIGKGRGRRWHRHEQMARNNVWGRKYAIIRDMQSRGVAVLKVKLHDGLTHTVAHEYEIALIAAIGRHPNGPLTNLTDGGDGGASGAKLSPETIAKRSAATRGQKRSPEARARMSAARLGIKFSPEACANISAGKRGKKRTPEAIAKSAAGNLGKPMSQDAVARSAAARSGKKRTPEQRARMSAGRLGMKLSIEHRDNISAGVRRALKRCGHCAARKNSAGLLSFAPKISVIG